MQRMIRMRVIWVLTAAMALVAALVGVLSPSVYERVITSEVMPGTLSQDYMTVAAAAIALVLAIRVRADDARGQVVLLGIMAFLFYAYGVYSIERVYNSLYLLYMAILGLSFYATIYGVAMIAALARRGAAVPRLLRIVSIVFLLFVPAMFYPLWIGRLLPMLRAGAKPEFFYSIYILDLSFFMPAFLIAAARVIKKDALGLVVTPALFVLGFALLSPLPVGELLKPGYGAPTDWASFWLFLPLSLVFLVLGIVYLFSLRVGGGPA